MAQVDLVVVAINDQAACVPLSKMDHCIVMVYNNVWGLLTLCLLLGLLLLAGLVELALHVLEHLLHVLDAGHPLHAHHVEGEIIVS